ncbi:hypothetical protein E2542_SST12499 [Spatholobus suberectus]|nr:hypothetical protein E2542_SST12499 [Spatholobus suberectus]
MLMRRGRAYVVMKLLMRSHHHVVCKFDFETGKQLLHVSLCGFGFALAMYLIGRTPGQFFFLSWLGWKLTVPTLEARTGSSGERWRALEIREEVLASCDNHLVFRTQIVEHYAPRLLQVMDHNWPDLCNTPEQKTDLTVSKLGGTNLSYSIPCLISASKTLPL